MHSYEKLRKYDRPRRHLKGRTVLVTAAAQDIGRACVERFYREGARVVATDISPEALKDAPFDSSCLDVCDPSAVADLASRCGPISVLVNCAGIVHSGTILDCSLADWEKSFDVNVTLMYQMIQAVLPGMLELGGESTINLSSAVSSVKGARNRFAYGSSKAAVIGLTKAVAADFVLQGVRCNAICSGTTESPSLFQRINKQADEEGIGVEEILARFVARQPMGRLGRPEKIAALAAYLADDDAAFITGQAIQIDGGWSL